MNFMFEFEEVITHSIPQKENSREREIRKSPNM